MAKIFLIFTLLFVRIQAQFPQDTQYQTISVTTPALPPLLGSIVDSSVPDPIKITRITEYVSAWSWYPQHEYSKIQPWNSNATLYKFYSRAIYDAQTHQLLYQIQNAGSIYPTYWSNTDPDLLYGFMNNGDIKTYSVSQQQITLVGHVYYDSLQQINYEYFKLGPGEGNFDENDKYVAFVGKHNTDMDVIIYDLQQQTILHKETFPGAWGTGPDYSPDYVDWVSVSLSGNYVVIMWDHNACSPVNPFNGHYGVEVYDRNMQFLRRIADYGNHGDFAYAQDGDEVFVQFWGPTGSMSMYYLDRLERVVLLDNYDFSQYPAHISGRNLKRPGWVYANITQQDIGVTLAVKLDTTQTVEYFGHHYSTGSSYEKSPMPVPNPEGTKIMFKSDFGDSTTGVVYTFEATKYLTTNVKNPIQKEIAVFPNPSSDFINVFANEIIQQISIIDATGRIILDKKTNAHFITVKEIKTFSEGIFQIRIKTPTETFIKKIVIKR